MRNPFKGAIDLFQWSCRKDDRYVLEIVRINRMSFTDDFVRWLPSNLHVFGEFCARAKALIKSGRSHYGAKTIVEVIRYNTDIRQHGGLPFKIDNTHTSYLVRLCELVYPETVGLFEKRVAKKPIREQETRDAFIGDRH